MASSRDERFLMRQRGAGVRQLHDFGFNISIPGVRAKTPLKRASVGRPRKTPQSGAGRQRNSSKTPQVTPSIRVNPSRKLPSARAKRSDAGAEAQEGALDSRAAEEARKSPERIKEAPGVSHIDESGGLGRGQKETLARNLEASRLESPDVPLGDLENTAQQDETSLPGPPSRKRKKSASIGQTSRKRARETPPSADPPELMTPVIEDMGSSPLVQTRRKRGRPSLQTATRVDASAADPEPKSSVTKKRKKRKSIGIPPKKRKQAVETSSSPAQQAIDDGDDGEDEVEEDGGEASEIGGEEEGDDIDEPVQARLKARGRGCLSCVSLPIVEEDEGEEEDELVERESNGRDETDTEEELVQEDSTEVTALRRKSKGKPARRIKHKRQAPRRSETLSSASKTIGSFGRKGGAKKGRTQALNSTKGEESQDQPSKRQRDGAIPITVYRHSHPKNVEMAETEAEDDVLAGPAPFPKKGSVNAIDVLAQICREIITKSLAAVQESAKNEPASNLKAQLKRKRQAIEMFGDVLDDRLFQMTEVLDHNYALNVRLKQANKMKVALRQDLLERRRQHEIINLRMDDVRVKHEKAANMAQGENELNTMLHDIELAVHRGLALPRDDDAAASQESSGLEQRLRKAALNVSSNAGQQGLLDQVKAFNALLERALVTL